MALDPQFAATPRTAQAVISAANTNRTNTGTIVDIFTAGTNGSLVRKITIQASGTTTAGMVRLWLNIGGTTLLYREIAVSAITPSATVAAFNSTLTLYDASSDGLPLPATAVVRASTNNAETFNVIVEGGDY